MLDGSKSVSMVDIYPWLLKSGAKSLAPSLTQLFNQSLCSGSVPQAFKLANVTAVLKPNQDPSRASSCRAISLITTSSKVLESMVLEQISSFLHSSQLFNEQQFGFRQGRSCEDLLFTNINKWQIARDESKFVAVAFL